MKHFSVVIPFRSAIPERVRNLEAVLHHWNTVFPSAEVIVADDGVTEGPFNKNTALNRGAKKAKGACLVFADADAYIESGCVDAIRASLDAPFGIPWRHASWLTNESTVEILANPPGSTFRVGTYAYSVKHRNFCPALLFTMTRKFYRRIQGFDERHPGWWSDDLALIHLMNGLRVTARREGEACVAHLWHEPSPNSYQGADTLHRYLLLEYAYAGKVGSEVAESVIRRYAQHRKVAG